jgi:hypothetical protein
VVARASKVGVSGRDHYPWDWYLMDDTVEFGSSGLRLQGSTETLQGAIDFIEANANRYGLTYKRELRERDAKREQALVEAQAENAKAESALAAMVRKLDARDKRNSRGYVTKRDELIAILSEVSKHVSVVIIEEELPYAQAYKEISVTIKLGLTLERKLL